MMKKVGAILFLVLMAGGLAQAQASRDKNSFPTPAPPKSLVPWVVPVVHVVDLHKTLARMRKQQGVRIGVPGSAPRNIINVVTGLVVDDRGHIVTRLANLDPEDKDQKITITTGEGQSHPARVVGIDYATGFTVLHVDSLKVNLPNSAIAATPANTTEVKILSADFVSRAALAKENNRIYITPSIKVSDGRVDAGSIYSRARGALTLYSSNLLSRNDGSIVMNSDDQIVGMAQYAGFGRAYLFPVETIRDQIVKRVIEKNGSVSAGWLGVTGVSVAQLPHGEREILGLTGNSGVVLREIVDKGPAAISGLKPNDIILEADDYEVIGTADLMAMLSSSPAGRSLRLRLVREHKPLEVNVVLGARAQENPWPDAFLQSELLLNQRNLMEKRLEELGPQYRSYLKKELTRENNEVLRELGIEIRQLQESLYALDRLEQEQRKADQQNPATAGVRADNRGSSPEQVPQAARPTTFAAGFVGSDLTPQLAAFFGTESGIRIDSVSKGSAAESAGLKAGDVIVEAQGQAGLTTAQLKNLFSTQQGSISLKVVRKKQPIAVTIDSGQ
ncbi:MAG: PDZ domain-containing protein [Blastocatellia bacterium]|nr:PDZ domain-containing protein [Blastocatellia bacterium]